MAETKGHRKKQSNIEFVEIVAELLLNHLTLNLPPSGSAMKKFRKAKKESGRSPLASVIELPPIVTECTTWLTQHGAQRSRPRHDVASDRVCANSSVGRRPVSCLCEQDRLGRAHEAISQA
jgi:hypothetical protein